MLKIKSKIWLLGLIISSIGFVNAAVNAKHNEKMFSVLQQRYTNSDSMWKNVSIYLPQGVNEQTCINARVFCSFCCTVYTAIKKLIQQGDNDVKTAHSINNVCMQLEKLSVDMPLVNYPQFNNIYIRDKDLRDVYLPKVRYILSAQKVKDAEYALVQARDELVKAQAEYDTLKNINDTICKAVN